MVLISDGVRILEDTVASGREKNSSFCTAVLSVLWVVLLLTVEALNGDNWYMLASRGSGMVQNVVAAEARKFGRGRGDGVG